MKSARCKDGIALARLINFHKLEYTKVIHKKGDKTSLWDRFVGEYRLMKEYDDTIIQYNHKTFTLEELSEYLGYNIYVDKYNTVYIYPQVIIRHIENEYAGYLEYKIFDTDKEAEEYFDNIIKDYNLQKL